MIDFALPEDVAQLETELLRFAADAMRPRMRDAERAGSWDPRITQTLDGFSLATLDLPEDVGGAGAGMLAKVVALEAVAYGDAGGLPAYDIGPAAAAMAVCPDAELVAEMVESCARHEASVHLAIRPPDEGTVRSLRVPWAAGTAPARWLWLIAGDVLTCDEMGESPGEHVESAAFNASAGIGMRHFEALANERWALSREVALAVRGRARLWPAAVLVGIARASLDYATEYAKERVVAGRPVAHHQGNAFAIAEAAARLDAARLAVRVGAWRVDAGDADAGAWATLAYLEAADASPAVCDLGVQLLGGHGYVTDHPCEKWFRESRMLTLLWGGREAAFADADAVCAASDPLLDRVTAVATPAAGREEP